MRLPKGTRYLPHVQTHKQKLEHRRFCFATFLLRCAAGQARVVGGEDGEVGGNARASDGGQPRRDGNEDVPGVHQECPQQTRGVLRYAWLDRRTAPLVVNVLFGVQGRCLRLWSVIVS